MKLGGREPNASYQCRQHSGSACLLLNVLVDFWSWSIFSSGHNLLKWEQVALLAEAVSHFKPTKPLQRILSSEYIWSCPQKFHVDEICAGLLGSAQHMPTKSDFDGQQHNRTQFYCTQETTSKSCWHRWSLHIPAFFSVFAFPCLVPGSLCIFTFSSDLCFLVSLLFNLCCLFCFNFFLNILRFKTFFSDKALPFCEIFEADSRVVFFTTAVDEDFLFCFSRCLLDIRLLLFVPAPFFPWRFDSPLLTEGTASKTQCRNNTWITQDFFNKTHSKQWCASKPTCCFWFVFWSGDSQLPSAQALTIQFQCQFNWSFIL